MPAVTIASSTDLRLAAIAARVHRAGPDVLLEMLRAQVTSSNPLIAIERFAMATLPLPSRPAPACVVDISSRFNPTVRQ